VGVLGTIPTYYFFPFSEFTNEGASGANMIPVPYFNKTETSKGFDDLDDYIGSALNTAILEIATIDKSGIIRGANSTSQQKVFIQAAAALQNLPHSLIYFKNIDHENKNYEIHISAGTDIRLTSSTNFPAPGARQLIQLTQLTNGFLRNTNIDLLGRALITQGLRIMPSVQSNEFNLPFGGIIGSILYPFGVSFLLPVF
jgi:hypothetical protein